MYTQVQIDTTDNEQIPGFIAGDVADGVSDEGVTFYHPQDGAESFIPNDEINAINPQGTVSEIQITGPEKDTSTGAKSSGKKAPPKKRENGEPTKYEQAYEVLKDVVGQKSRKECIELLVEKCEMTPAGASTYHNKVKKAIIG